MTYKNKLIKFLKIKRNLLYVYSNVKYMTKEDLKEITTWSEEKCNKIYDYITTYINSIPKDNAKIYDYINRHIKNAYNISISNPIQENKVCPWCVYYYYIKKENTCKDCQYGKRNGFCDENNSRYNKLINNEEYTRLTIEDYLFIISKIG